MPVECVTAKVNGPSGTFDRGTFALPHTGARAHRRTRKVQLERSLYISKRPTEVSTALQRMMQKNFFPATNSMDVLTAQPPRAPLLSIALASGGAGAVVQ